jgi:guanylate kinase
LKRGELFIISAPSGAGKTTVLKRVLAELPGVAFSISHTTRAPRPGEEEGRDYCFVDKETFRRMRDAEGFLEWAEVHGNLYGTSRQMVENLIVQSLDVILDIDVQGARQIRQQKETPGHFVFIVPPSLAELKRRLIGRGTETPASLATRYGNAKRELADLDSYDFLIVNDAVDDAVEILRAIILSQRSRGRRSFAGQPVDLSGFVTHEQI